MKYYAKPLARLINELSRLPGIGGKSAQRLAFHILSMDEKEAFALAESITFAKKNMKYCSVCGNLTDIDLAGNVLTVNVQEEYIFSLLMSEENLNLLNSILSGINTGVMLSIRQKPAQNAGQENILKLKKKFGENLRIES